MPVVDSLEVVGCAADSRLVTGFFGAGSWVERSWAVEAAVVAVTADGSLTGLSECRCFFGGATVFSGRWWAADASVGAVAWLGSLAGFAGDLGAVVVRGELVASFTTFAFAGDFGVVGVLTVVVVLGFFDASLPSAAFFAESMTPCTFATPPRGLMPALVGVRGDFLSAFVEDVLVSMGFGFGFVADTFALSCILFAAPAARAPIPLVCGCLFWSPTEVGLRGDFSFSSMASILFGSSFMGVFANEDPFSIDPRLSVVFFSGVDLVIAKGGPSTTLDSFSLATSAILLTSLALRKPQS